MSKANVAVKMPETRGVESEGNVTASRYNDATRNFTEAGKVDGAARNAKDATNEAEEIGRAEEEGMCHPTGPGKSHASN